MFFRGEMKLFFFSFCQSDIRRLMSTPCLVVEAEEEESKGRKCFHTTLKLTV